MEDPITCAVEYITDNQTNILAECIKKKNGGLSLPMGSGKTYISLLLGLHLTKKEKILIVVSKSLISNWIKEINKFFKDNLKYEIVHGDYTKLSDWKPKKDTKVVITTPQVTSKFYKEYNIEPKFEYYTYPVVFGPAIKNYNVPDKPLIKKINLGAGEYLYGYKWGTLIIDEAQMYNKVTSNNCKSLSAISANYRWLLSGTMFDEPKIERIFGYYLLLNDKNIPRNLPDFEKYVKSSNFKGLKKSLIKREINADFKKPKVNSEIVSHTLDKNEAKIYLSMKEVLNAIRKQLNIYKSIKDSENVRKFTSFLMAMVTYLRQSLVCPLIPIANVAINMADLECKSELSQIISDKIAELELTEWLNDEDAMYSSRLRNTIMKINKHKNDRIIIFSCFRTCLDALKEYIPKDRLILTIGSNIQIKKRGKIIEEFERTENGILLLTYDIGANGLNLQCANTILLLDFWWNADKTKQAIARALRYGQKANKVNIYYFTSNTGLENILFKKQQSKLTIVDELYNGNIKTKIPKISLSAILSILDNEENMNLLKNINAK